MTQTPPAYDIFLSYARADEAWVDGYLLDALRGSGLNVLTQEEFRPGVPVLAEYERAIVESRYVVLVLSPAWSGETFGEFVDLLANFHGRREGSWPVVPLILQPTDLPLRLAHLTPVDATQPDKWPKALERIARLVDMPLAPAPELPECPYPGMTPFTEEQEKFFFGRDKEIGEAVERLRLHPFLCVIGPSGSGKSSLVYAGVIPALRRARHFGPGAWDVRVMRPGERPLTTLAAALNLLTGEVSVLPPKWGELEGGKPTLLFIDQFEELFTQAPATDAQTFLDCLTALHGHPNLHILLTVRADFYPELMGCSLWPSIQSNRLDLPPLGRTQLAAAIVQPAAQVGVSVDPLLVERLTADAAGEKGALPLVQECLRLLWQRVKRHYLPAQAYAGMAEGERNGLQIAIDRRAAVVYNNLPADARPIARRIFLRLIQFGEGRADTRRQVAEDELWATGDDPTLFGGTLQTLIDRRLLTASGGESESARRVDIAHEALIAGWALLRGWIDERRSAEQTRRRLEAAAQRWEELARAGGLLDPVELAEAQRWLAQPDSQEVGGASNSLSGLIEASTARIQAEEEEKEAARQRELVQATEVATLNARRAAEQAQARRRTLLLAAALLTAVVVIGVVGWFWQQSRLSEAGAVDARSTAEVAATAEATARSAAEAEAQAAAASETEAQKQRGIAEEQRQLAEAAAAEAEAARKAARAEAEREARRARAEQFAVIAKAEIARNNASNDLALLLARQAVLTTWEVDGFVNSNADSALRQAVDMAPPWRMNLPKHYHTDWVRSVAFSPDSKVIVTASNDQTARVWDVASGREINRLIGHIGPVTSAAFSPDGHTIITTGDDHTVRLWDTATGTEIDRFEGHTDSVTSATFSLGGQWVVTTSNDRTARLWDVATRKEIERFEGHTDSVISAAFSPDGQILATASQDQTVQLWDINTDTQHHRLLADNLGIVWSVKFSPDGQTLITRSEGSPIRLWDIRTGREIGRLEESITNLTSSPDPFLSSSANSVAFSPNGEWIVSASPNSFDFDAYLWDVNTKQKIGLGLLVS